MKITYIGKRSRDGIFYCYDLVADGIYFNLFLSDGAPPEKIAQYAEDWLVNPFPEHRRNDSISVIMGSLSEEEPVEEAPPQEEPEESIRIFPEGIPSMKWKAVEMQNYLATYGIDYSDGDTKATMLVAIEKHFGS